MTKPELTPEQEAKCREDFDTTSILASARESALWTNWQIAWQRGLAAGQQGNAVSQPVVNEVIISGVQALIDSLLPNFEYVGVSLRVSQEDHAAIRSAIAGASTALHLLKARLNPPPAAPSAPLDEGRVRKEVVWFAEKMEAILRLNDHKSHWSDATNGYLLDRLWQEVHELQRAMLRESDPKDVIAECCDVANFAMMIADNFESIARELRGKP